MKELWLEVALQLDDDEVVEAVSEVLARFTPRPLAYEYTHLRADERNHLVDLGPVTVRAYIPLGSEDDAPALQRRIQEALHYLRAIRPFPHETYRILEPEDWAEAWKQAYHPIPIGERLVVVPAWLENPYPDRVAVVLEPGMAFGTGMHPSTRLALRAAERYAAQSPRVLDIGTGSGILAIAALKLGAERAVGVDIEPLAIEVARENARRNQVADRLTLLPGSLDVLENAPFSEGHLVFANILAPILEDLFAQGLAEHVLPQGILVLSGILAEQAPRVARAAREAGLEEVHRWQEGEWVALVYRRPSKRS
ncbi:MAG: 50S ribosomal protein L11 methyltransferase [Chloroflexi bacterium]|nr:50S ribosomal protein L11 methyltransferase [Chloroflexota bacterium]